MVPPSDWQWKQDLRLSFSNMDKQQGYFDDEKPMFGSTLKLTLYIDENFLKLFASKKVSFSYVCYNFSVQTTLNRSHTRRYKRDVHHDLKCFLV